MEKRSGFCIEAKVSITLHSRQLFQGKCLTACGREELVQRLESLGIHISKPPIKHVVSQHGSLERADNRNEDGVQRGVNSKVDRLLYLVNGLTRETDHEETRNLDAILPCPEDCLLGFINFQILTNQPLIFLRRRFDGNSHEMSTGLFHQGHQLFVEPISPNAIRKLQVNLQVALHKATADFLRSFQVKIKDVVHHHEFFYALVPDEVFHLIQDLAGRQATVSLAVNRVTIGTLVGT